MKWYKPYGLAIYSSITIGLKESVIINKGWWTDEPQFVIEDIKTLRLDPGGMFYAKAPFINFNVQELSFEIQRHNIESIKWKLKNAEPYNSLAQTIYLWPGIALTISNQLVELLLAKLSQLGEEDESIHESLDISLLKNQLNSHPNILLNLKRENPDE